MYDVLMLDARFRQAVVTVRSLGRRGPRVATSDTTSDAPAFYSRWSLHHFLAPSNGSSPQTDLNYLEQLLHRSPAQVLIPAADWTVDLIRRHRVQLDRHMRIALAKEPALASAINKEQTLAIAKPLGLGVPRGVSLRSTIDLPAALC